LNVTAFDVPLAVVITICADVAPVDGGTVTVHEFWAGQLVGATCPLNVAVIWPFELRKFAPATWMPWPAAPDAGVIEEMTGGPPATAGTAGAVVEVFEVLEDPADPRRPECRGEAGWCELGCVEEAVDAGGAATWGPLLPSETANAMPAATTSAATTATETTSQRSRCLEGSEPPGAGSHCVGGPTHSVDGSGSERRVGWRERDGGGVIGGVLIGGVVTDAVVSADGAAGAAVCDRSRARRTALSIAPSARRLGVPRGGSAAVPSDITFLRLGSSFPRFASMYSRRGDGRKWLCPSGVSRASVAATAVFVRPWPRAGAAATRGL
jgi:hypothetical protein